MYWRQIYVDDEEYPEVCPDCGAKYWLDFDWETGLGYCQVCGYFDGMPEEEDIYE